MEATTGQGVFRGAVASGILSFKGVPYAGAPHGAARFEPPQPPARHEGVADATGYGATVSAPPQRSTAIDALLPDPVRAGPDPLNLNIWTPSLQGRLPVLVWLHGGGFVTGAGSTTAFDGSAFARDGVVAVTVNYRLAAEGFAALPGTVANRGLLDQIAALEWVRENIEAFGGDPELVTVAGESAGGMAVLTLLAMPRARGLFRRAIAQSGDGHHVHTSEQGALIAAELAAELGVEASADSFAAVPAERLHDATNVVIGRATGGQDPRFAGFRRLAFQPVVDGDTLPVHPVDAARAGSANDVDLLIGTNAEEYGLFVAPLGLWDSFSAPMLEGSVRRLGVDVVLAAYRAHLPEAGPAELFVAVQSDWFCKVAARRFVDARAEAGADSRVYEFSWRPAGFGGRVGACHTLEVPFVFDTLQDDWGKELRGSDAPQGLADRMHAAWVAFVTTGDPGWPLYGKERQVQRIGEDDELQSDPEPWRPQVWEGLI